MLKNNILIQNRLQRNENKSVCANIFNKKATCIAQTTPYCAIFNPPYLMCGKF